MAPLINKETVETDNGDPIYQQVLSMSDDQRNKLKNLALQQISNSRQRMAMSSTGGTNLQDIANIFLQEGGAEPIKSKGGDLNDYIMKEMIKRKLEGDPMEKYRQEQTIKSEIEGKDPYRQSQIELNKAMLENIRGTGAGGALIYREQDTGIEIPQEEALAGIAQGKQYIIKRRVATRQGVKEEPISEPKPMTEGEVKTSTGAEEVLKEIDDLEKIIKSEPAGKGASIPIFGKSAQAKGVKIPFIAPYGISEKGQEYRTLRESINNRLLYLRSGAQINDKEYQRLSGMLPELFRADTVDLQQLTRFKNEFKGIMEKLRTGKRGIENIPTQAGQGQSSGFKIISARPTGSQ